MATADHLKTYTITDLQVAPVTGDTPGTLIDVPGIRSCQITVSNDAVELRGDNALLSVVDQGNGLEFSLEEGGMDLDALETILGGSTTTTGTGGTEVRRWDLAADDARPYFTLVGVAPSDDGANDLHVVVWKAKATGNFEVTLQDQEFATPTIAGRGVGRSDTKAMLSFIQHATPAAAAIPA